MKKERFVTEKYLDKKLEEQAKIIIEAVNFGFDRNRKEHLKFEEKIDMTRTLLDGYVKAQEDFREEFKIMKHKMSKIEKVIKDKLGVEI